MSKGQMAKARPLLSQGQSDSDLVERADSANWQEAGFTLPNILALLATACVSSRLIAFQAHSLSLGSGISLLYVLEV